MNAPSKITTPMARFRQVHALIESIMGENDPAHEALSPVLAALEDAHADTLAAFEDEFGKPVERHPLPADGMTLSKMGREEVQS